MLILLIVALLGIIIFQISKANEYVAQLKGEDAANEETDNINAWLWIAFMIVFFIGIWWTTAFTWDLMILNSASEHGKWIDFSFNLTTWVCGLVFIATHIMLFWFAVLGTMGAWRIAQTPEILLAINPIYAWNLIGEEDADHIDIERVLSALSDLADEITQVRVSGQVEVEELGLLGVDAAAQRLRAVERRPPRDGVRLGEGVVERRTGGRAGQDADAERLPARRFPHRHQPEHQPAQPGHERCAEHRHERRGKERQRRASEHAKRDDQ